MAERSYLKQVEDFIGLDYKSAGLVGGFGSAVACTNLINAKSYSLKNRFGYQLFGQPGGFLGIHSWSYPSPDDGSTVTELIAINDRLWKLTTATFTITEAGVGTTTWGYDIFPAGAGVAQFRLYRNGILETTTSTTATPSSVYTTVSGLITTIQALSNFNAAKTAGVKFGQVNTGTPPTNTVITVLAGHNYVAGDYATFFNATNKKLEKRKIESVTGTALTVTDWGSNSGLTNNQILGPYAAAACGLAYRNQATVGTAGSSVTYTFPYWTPVVDSTREDAPFASWWNDHMNNGGLLSDPVKFEGTDKKLFIFTKSSAERAGGAP